MPRNGSGQYSAPLSSWNPPIEGNLATPADWSALLADIASTLTQSISADGQTLMTGALNMGGNRITQLGAPTNAGNALRREQVTKGADIASGETITIPSEGSLFEVTGDSTITEVSDTYPGRTAILKFEAGITIENSSSLILPGGADITTTAGDLAIFVNTDPGIWVVMAYQQGDNAVDPVMGSRLLKIDRFTSSGDWSNPGRLAFVRVRGISGGGSGGGAQGDSSSGSCAGGGGAGAPFDCIIQAADLGDTETVTVGSGGAAPSAGRNSGNAGGSSSFGSHVTGTGGAGGTAGSTGGNSVTEGGAGGSASYSSTATRLMPAGNLGNNGGPGLTDSSAPRWSGYGADSPWGSGGIPKYGAIGNNAGASGEGYGSGGSGAKSTGTTAVAGGGGEDGYIEVWSYVR